jgi:hypothetical protein
MHPSEQEHSVSESTEPPVLGEATLEQIASVASEPDAEHPLTGKQVAAVIAAYHNVASGDPVGTMRRNPENGAIALKTMAADGMLIWRISVPDGSQYNDLQPTLTWPILEVGQS